jgi:hypothetical protein
MSGTLLLADIARGEKDVDDRDTILAAAPDKIADRVVILNEWRLANTQPVQDIDPRVVTVPRKKVGRNEPPAKQGLPIQSNQIIKLKLELKMVPSTLSTSSP